MTDLDALERFAMTEISVSSETVLDLIQRLRKAEARSVPIEAGDVELFGDDPYRSARAWHDAWMKSEARIAQLERVREAAISLRDEVDLFIYTGGYGLARDLTEAIDAALAAVEEPVEL